MSIQSAINEANSHLQFAARYDVGCKTMKTIFGPAIEESLRRLAETSPDLARLLVEFPFGDIYTRPILDLKVREMLAVSALTVLGYAQSELKEHIRGALNVGFTREELIEIILQMAVYAGFPAALEAIKTAATVFGEGCASSDRNEREVL